MINSLFASFVFAEGSIRQFVIGPLEPERARFGFTVAEQ